MAELGVNANVTMRIFEQQCSERENLVDAQILDYTLQYFSLVLYNQKIFIID